MKPTAFSNLLNCLVMNGYGAWNLVELSGINIKFRGKTYSKVLQKMSIPSTNQLTVLNVKATKGIVAGNVYLKCEREKLMVAATALTKATFSKYNQMTTTIEKVYNITIQESSFVFMTLWAVQFLVAPWKEDIFTT